MSFSFILKTPVNTVNEKEEDKSWEEEMREWRASTTKAPGSVLSKSFQNAHHFSLLPLEFWSLQSFPRWPDLWNLFTLHTGNHGLLPMHISRAPVHYTIPNALSIFWYFRYNSKQALCIYSSYAKSLPGDALWPIRSLQHPVSSTKETMNQVTCFSFHYLQLRLYELSWPTYSFRHCLWFDYYELQELGKRSWLTHCPAIRSAGI